MKVMTYNMLCGGQAEVNGEERLDFIIDVIRSEAPDILALQEANGLHDHQRWQYLADRIGLPFHNLSAGALFEDGERYHVAVFSRYRLDQAHHHTECKLQSAALSVVADSPLGPVALTNLHLHAYCESERLAELDDLLAYDPGHVRRLILGDMNALSRSDPYGSDDGEFKLQFDVIDRLSRRFTDLGAPSPGETAWTHPSRAIADHPFTQPRRIDYIFASASLGECAGPVRVIRSETAHRASDHFPVVVTFS